MKNKIILSTVTTLALLLSGCSDGGTKTGGGDIGTENPTPPIAEIPTEPEVTDPEVVEPIEPANPYKPGGWYARTVVSATAPDGKVYSHSTAGVFGKLIDSQDSLDRHDIPAYGPSTLQVIFPQAEQDNADSNGYFSAYKSFSEDDSSEGSWEFQIKNQDYPDLSSAPITIALKGVYDLTYKKVAGKISYEEKTKVNSEKAQELTLLDVDNAAYYSVEELKTATLTMDGKHTRTFKWVLGTVEESDYTPSASIKDDKATLKGFAVSKANDISSISSKGGKFGLPPQ